MQFSPRWRSKLPLVAAIILSLVVPLGLPLVASAQDDGATDAPLSGGVARIDAIWSECRAKYGADGKFLFGQFGAADAMFAPVVWRFHTYAVEVSVTAGAYMRAVMALPAWNEWRDAARREPWVLPEDEVDWPQVLRQ